MRRLGVMMAAAVLVLGTAAMAQDDAVRPWSLRAGGDWLTSGSGIDAAGHTGFAIGLSYEAMPKSMLAGAAGKASIDLDYMRHAGNSGRLDVIGLTYAERYFGEPAEFNESVQPYFGFGVGIYHRTVRVPVLLGLNTPGDATREYSESYESSTNTGFGGKLIAGAKLNERVLAEASFNYVGSVEGVRADGVSIMLGMRF